MINQDKELSREHSRDDEIDLTELFNVLWSSKLLILIITFIFAITSIVYSLSLENVFESESVLIARESSESSALSQYSNIAAIAGVNLSQSESNEVTEIIEIINSRQFTKHLISFKGILPSIIAAESYDKTNDIISYDPSIYDVETDTWTRKPTSIKKSKPTYLEAHKVILEDILSISQDNKTGFVHIKVTHISPIFAKEFLELIVREANNLKRTKDIDSSKRALNYLQEELSSTPLVDIKKSINNLISAQLETQMLAKIHSDYKLIYIEPPFVPETKSAPSRAFICITGTLFGALLGVILVLFRFYFSEVNIVRNSL